MRGALNFGRGGGVAHDVHALDRYEVWRLLTKAPQVRARTVAARGASGRMMAGSKPDSSASTGMPRPREFAQDATAAVNTAREHPLVHVRGDQLRGADLGSPERRWRSAPGIPASSRLLWRRQPARVASSDGFQTTALPAAIAARSRRVEQQGIIPGPHHPHHPAGTPSEPLCRNQQGCQPGLSRRSANTRPACWTVQRGHSRVETTLASASPRGLPRPRRRWSRPRPPASRADPPPAPQILLPRAPGQRPPLRLRRSGRRATRSATSAGGVTGTTTSSTPVAGLHTTNSARTGLLSSRVDPPRDWLGHDTPRVLSQRLGYAGQRSARRRRSERPSW